MKKLTIGIDFDGTCVTHDYPKVGKDIGAVPVLKELVEKGHNLILYTMRSRKELSAAINWFNLNEIPLIYVNENPTQLSWTTSRKIFANIYLDDAALGAPLKSDGNGGVCYDWRRARAMLKDRGIL